MTWVQKVGTSLHNFLLLFSITGMWTLYCFIFLSQLRVIFNRSIGKSERYINQRQHTFFTSSFGLHSDNWQHELQILPLSVPSIYSNSSNHWASLRILVCPIRWSLIPYHDSCWPAGHRMWRNWSKVFIAKAHLRISENINMPSFLKRTCL